MFRLSQIEFHRFKDKSTNKWYSRPVFFSEISEESSETLKHAVNQLNNLVGTPADLFNQNDVESIFENPRIGSSFVSILLNHFFHFVGEGQLLVETSSLRLQFFDFVATKYNGWIPPTQRQEVFQEFIESNDLSLDYKQLLKNIYADHSRYTKLKVKEEFLLLRFQMLFDRTVFKCLVWNSEEIDYHFESLPAEIAKVLFFLARRLYIYCEIEKTDNYILLKLSLPPALIRSSISKRNLIRFISAIQTRIPSDSSDFQVIFSLKQKTRVRNIQVQSAQISSLVSTDKEEKELQFDSVVEKDIYYLLKRYLPTWTIKREVSTIVLSNHRLFLPDFTLIYRNVTVYLEVVGFWLQTYLDKKREKIRLLREDEFENIVFLYSEDLKLPKAFFHGYEAFPYLKKLDISSTCRHLQQKYEKPEYDGFMNNLLPKMDLILQEFLSREIDPQIISLDQIRKEFQIKPSEQLNGLSKEIISNLLLKNFVFVPARGFLKRELVLKMHEILQILFSNKKGIKLTTIQQKTHDIIHDDSWLIPVLEVLSYTVKWRNLNEQIVLRPKTKKKPK